MQDTEMTDHALKTALKIPKKPKDLTDSWNTTNAEPWNGIKLMNGLSPWNFFILEVPWIGKLM